MNALPTATAAGLGIGGFSTTSAIPIARPTRTRTRDVPHEASNRRRPHLQAVRLVALRGIEAQHRAALVASIQRAERGIRLVEALDERFDGRLAATLSRLRVTEASMPVTTPARMRPQASTCATTASTTPSIWLERSERSTHVPAYTT